MSTLLTLNAFTDNAVKINYACIPCTTNCQEVTVAAIICGMIVSITFIVAVTLLIHSIIRGSRLRRQKQAELNNEKEERWFSLRKEYQSAILRILEPKETSTKGIDNQKERNAESGEWKGCSKEDYINELRDCIKWIEEHWVDKREK